MPHLSHLSLIVRDYDEAIAWYSGNLGFTLVENTHPTLATTPTQVKLHPLCHI